MGHSAQHRPVLPRILNWPPLPAEEGRVAVRMQSQTNTSWAWAVLDHEGRVVMLVGGQGAWAEAQEWAARGYRVTDVELHD